MTTLYGIYGASGFGRETLPILREQLSGSRATLVFIDDSESSKQLNNHEVVSWDEFLRRGAQLEKYVALAIANSSVRQTLHDKCRRAGVDFVNVIAANIVKLDDVVIGEGAILSPFVTITSNVRIGRHFHANIYSYVAHDCVIGDFVTFGPGVKCNGNVHIEDHAYIGTGAVIKQGQPGKPLIIGRGAVVGMGAVVTRDVPPGVTVVGNPARPIVKV